MNTTPGEIQDRADMARLAGGDDAALDDLMSRHSERLFHYLIRVLHDESEAADLAQETFTRVYLNRTKFKSSHRFSTWLYTIATNLARDRQRWLTRHRQVSLDASSESQSDLKEILPSQEKSPDETLAQQERVAAVRTALAALPEELRLPLILAEFEEQSHAEIAFVLDCSAKAVEMRIYRARQQLRKTLGQLIESEP